MSCAKNADWVNKIASATDIQPVIESHAQLIGRVSKMRDGTIRALG
ncbi:MAG: hypothetical protein R3C03_18820 [Pirellulaceae bacterium]